MINAPATAASKSSPRDAAARIKQRQQLNDLIVRVGAICVILLLWEIFGRRISPLLFAPPSWIAAAAVDMVTSGELWMYVRPSVKVFTVGILLSVVAGIFVGVAMARIRVLDLSLEPFVIALYATPMVAIIPLVVIWLGFQDQAKIAVVFLMAVFPVLINTYQGVKSVDPKLLEVARSFRSTEAALWTDVVLPSSLPFIVAGVRLGIGRGLVGMVVADLYTSVSGVGYLIVRYAQLLQIDRLLVPVVLLAVLGVVLLQSLRWVEKRIAPWLYQDLHGD